LLKASSAREAFECLLKITSALILIDVCMPDLDGFELATMIREHPRFQSTAIIFISAVMMAHIDQLRGYNAGGVTMYPWPVSGIAARQGQSLRELYRKPVSSNSSTPTWSGARGAHTRSCASSMKKLDCGSKAHA